jgi:hypothetical protein
MPKGLFLTFSNCGSDALAANDWPAFRSVFRPISGEIEEFRKPSCALSPYSIWRTYMENVYALSRLSAATLKKIEWRNILKR